MLLFLLSTSTRGAPGQVYAQATDDSWATPTNLSHSGSSSSAVMVSDNPSSIDVVWQDAYDGSMFAYFNGSQWSQPQSLNFPFNPAVPYLIGDKSGLIHAFWIDEKGNLFYSQVQSSRFGNPASWQKPALLGVSVLTMAATLDGMNNIHLAFIQNGILSSNPAGVYYLHSNDRGSTWSSPVPLDQSAYLRGLKKDLAGVAIAVAKSNGETHLYVTWDNPPRLQVYLDRSTNGGHTWDAPALVDDPNTNPGAAAFFNIEVVAQAGTALVIWEAGDSAQSCNLYYQWSQDAGATWSDHKPVRQQASFCPQSLQWITGTASPFLLYANVSGSAYLLAWDSVKGWSDPQPQDVLSGFEDPATQSQVTLATIQIEATSQDQLAAVGSDSSGGGDTWFTSRAIHDVSTWFPQPSAWSSPQAITQGQPAINDPILVADADGHFHALWSQPGADQSNPAAYASIDYAQWDGQRWTQPVAVLSSTGGDLDQPAAAIDPGGRLVVVYRQGQATLQFSQVALAQAGNPGDWATPQTLPSPGQVTTSPDIAIDAQGKISVIFAVPINEGRGVYLVQSTDGGKTWARPAQIFDAARAGWDSVDQPHLALSSGGLLEATWGRTSPSSGGKALELDYARSTDGGATWNKADSFVNTPVDWSRLVSAGDKTVHRLWRESGANLLIKHQVSRDGGVTWSLPNEISSLGVDQGTPAVTEDRAGQLHLAKIYQDYSGNLVFSTWTWDGNAWTAGETLNLGLASALNGQSMAAAVSAQGHLVVVYAGVAIPTTPGGSPAASLFFTERTITLPAALPTPQPSTLVATATSIPAATATPEPTPLPTLAPAAKVDYTPHLGPISLSNKYTGLIVGGGIAVLIILAFLGFRLLTNWRSR